jgi:hypothetical protein
MGKALKVLKNRKAAGIYVGMELMKYGGIFFTISKLNKQEPDFLQVSMNGTDKGTT